MRVLLFTALIVFSLKSTVIAGEKLTESEMLLGGFKVANNIAELPDVIDIPENWIKLFREISLKTKQTGLEHGGCLKVGADLSEISKVGDTLKLTWVAGELQVGNKLSILIQHAHGGCHDNSLSDVHSHPDNAYPPILSALDLFGLTNLDLKTRFVVNNSGGYCLAIKTKNTHAIPPNYTSFFEKKITPYRWYGGELLKTRRAEKLLNALGLATYCSDGESKASKTVPYEKEIDIDDRLYILSAKGYFISVENNLKNPIKVTESYDPVLDEIFYKYLENLSKRVELTSLINDNREGIISTSSDDNKPYKSIRQMNPKDIYEYSLSHYITGENQQMIASLSDCYIKSGVISGSVTTDNYDKIKDRTLAVYDSEKRISSVVNGVLGMAHLESVIANEKYSGDCVFYGSTCFSEGKGIIDIAGHYRYEGTFKKGKKFGSGTMTSYIHKGKWRVKFSGNEDMEIIEKIE